MKPVTQRDIAEALGVSQSAVGLAISGRANQPSKGRLKQETIDLILAKAQEMGYRPHRPAQIMRQGKSMQIGLAYTGSAFQFVNEREESVAEALRTFGYEMVFLDTRWCKNGAIEVADYMLSARVDGMILSTSYTQPEELAHFASLPFPVIGLSSPQVGTQPVVRCDMADGMLKIFSHLVDENHRRIVLLSTAHDPRVPTSEWLWYQHLQVQGLKNGVRKVGGSLEILSIDDYPRWMSTAKAEDGPAVAILCNTAPPHAQHPYEGSAMAARKLLSSGVPLPDAILCTNDDWAFGLACELMRCGISIPQDVAITGFNDTALASYFLVPFTTVRQPSAAMCKLAVELLIKAIQGENCEQGVHLLPGELLLRASSRRIPGNAPSTAGTARTATTA